MKKIMYSIVFLLLGAAAHACAVPVFRYALERWPPDPFRLTLVHKGMSEVEVRAWLDPANQAYFDTTAYDLTTETLPEGASEALRAEAEQVTGTEARIHLEYPFSYDLSDPVIFSGPAHEANRKKVHTSPLREEIVKRILGGHATVWVLIPGEDEQTNSRLRDLLTLNIRRLNQSLELPETMLENYGPERREGVINDLPVVFSLLELDRDDPREAVVVRSLALMAGEEWDDKDTAWVMPVFGQGRALDLESSDDFTVDAMEDIAFFLTSSCSCEVKALNPGFDLFIVESWMEDLERSFVDESRMAPGLFNPLAYQPEPEMSEEEQPPETVEEEPSEMETEPEPVAETAGPDTGSESGVNGMILLGGVVVALLGVGLVFTRKGGGDA